MTKEELLDQLKGLRFESEYQKPGNHVIVGAIIILKIYDPEADEVYCWDLASRELNFLERRGMLSVVADVEASGNQSLSEGEG